MDDIACAVLGSGSEANAYLFEHKGTLFAIDNGFTVREFSRRASLVGRRSEKLRFLLLTHTHSDHIRGVAGLSRLAHAPVYMNSHIKLDRPPNKNLYRRRDINPGDSLEIDGVKITAFSLSHDSQGAQSYRLECGKTIFVLITDTGKVTREMHSIAFDADFLFLEANYNKKLLEKGPYPAHIKRRIKSDQGHLSNSDAIRFVNDLSLSGSLRKVFWCHLSAVNNSPGILREEIDEHLENPVPWHICPRSEMTCIDAGGSKDYLF